MQKTKNRIAAIAIAIFLTFSMSASMLLIPNASAHTPAWQIPTFAYIQAEPSTVGIGQNAVIYMFLGNAPIPSAALYNEYRFTNYTLTITGPNGTISTNYPIIQDPTGAQGFTFTPSQAGTYNLTFNYGGQTLNTSTQPVGSQYINDIYEPSSATTQLIVTQTPIPYSISNPSPLPTAYWIRPIYGENSNWYTISSNWLGTGSPVSSQVGSGTLTGFASSSTMERNPGDAIGPATSHIMWTYPIEEGGIVGNNQSVVLGNSYFEGSAYENRFDNPIIIDGYLFYTLPVSFTGSQAGATVCQNLQTGQILWTNPNIPPLSFGYIYDVQFPNQHGTFPAILFTSSFAQGFDAWTGQALFNVTGVPSGTAAQGPQGEQLRYVLTNLGTSANPSWNLGEWNSSRLWDFSTANPYTGGNVLASSIINTTGTFITTIPIPITGTTGTLPTGATTSVPYGSWLVVNASVNNPNSPQNSYDWNANLTWDDSPNGAISVVYAFYNNMMIVRNGTLPALEGSQAPYEYIGVNLNPSKGQIGSVLWTSIVSPPANNLTVSAGPVDPMANGGTGVFTEGYKETMQWVGYSMATGKQIWGPTPSQAPLDYFGNPIYPYVTGQTAYGNLYSSGYAGVLYCYSLTNGNLIWTYGNGGTGNSTNGYIAVPGNYPTYIQAVGNGIIYLATTEHTIETPIFPGAEARAVNATTGQELWTLSNYNGEFSAISYAIADGYATMFNGYDDQVYSVGQGPSATTLSAPDVSAALGTPILLKGTVKDVSAGTQQAEQKADFPNGVPCSSDASMSAWMSYVYQQQPFPTNFTGVTVTLSVIDPNHNTYIIGNATSDGSGTFNLLYTPKVSGLYTVIAAFAGTNGYWGSNAESTFNVLPAPSSSSATSTPTPAQTSVVNTYFVPAVIAIIIVIIVVGAVLAMLMLRKKP